MNNKNPTDFLLGCDPEFLICNGNSPLDASLNTNNAEFGYDGSRILFEVRPDPSNNPLDIVKNIHNIMLRQVKSKRSLLPYNWMAGSYKYRYSLGGHIHFGITPNRISRPRSTEILDNYVGAICLLIEDKSEALNRRKSGDYGFMGDIREQFHGGFEYRTPSSWLVSPHISAAMLCLAKTVMYEALNNRKFNSIIHVEDNHFTHIWKDDLKKNHFPNIWKEITKMSLYQQYKPHLDLIHFLVTNNLTWFPKNTMKQAWGLEQNKEKDLTLNSIWAKFKLNNVPNTLPHRII